MSALPDNFVHMKKFTNLDTTHHHNMFENENNDDMDNKDDFSSGEVDSIMISDQDLLNDTNTHLLHATAQKERPKVNLATAPEEVRIKLAQIQKRREELREKLANI